MGEAKADTALEQAKKTPKTRAEAGAALLVQGASFKDIAEMLDYSSPQVAKASVERVLAYNARANSIIDRISKLHGLDAPTQVQVTPTQEYLEEYTKELQRKMGLDPDVVEEADIFEDMGEKDG